MKTATSANRDTKIRILDAAESLFAEHGFAATSLRAITRHANVNLAAVHYHFGSKEGLVEAVFSRRLGPLNQERLELLDAVEARGGELEDVLRALIGPALRLSRAEPPASDVRSQKVTQSKVHT